MNICTGGPFDTAAGKSDVHHVSFLVTVRKGVFVGAPTYR